MKFEQLTARLITPELNQPFSIGAVDGQERVVGPKRPLITLHGLTSDGVEGYASIDTLPYPVYSNESTVESWAFVREIGETFINRELESPEQAVRALGYLVGHNFFKAGFANLWLDTAALKQGLPLYTLLGGQKEAVEVGISMPSTSTPPEVQTRIEQGYRRIKIKVGPSPEDFAKIAKIKADFPEIPLMIDANSSFDHRNPKHQKLLLDYAALNLLMIEQPLAEDDIRQHIQLQRIINQYGLPGYICLDESIHGFEDLRWAVEGGIPIINIKIARVGGLHLAQQMIEFCQTHHVQTWIGGMLEPTASKAHSLAMAAHPGVTLPSDISGTKAYFKEGQDPVTAPMTIDGSVIHVPNTPGRGWEVEQKILGRITQEKVVFKANKIHPVVCPVPLR